MMNADEVTVILRDIRSSLGYNRGVMPVVEDVFTHSDGSLHVVLPDRAEKSMCLGPGGRIASEFTKRVGSHTTFYGRDELRVRQHRLELTLRRCDELERTISENQRRMIMVLRDRVRTELDYPEREPKVIQSYQCDTAVAFSGGSDSCATALLLKEMGLSPVLLTVRLGEEFLNRRDQDHIRQLGEKIGLAHQFVEPEADHHLIAERAKTGDLHPCGPCHESMYKALYQYVRKSGHDILITGELLPTGRQAVVVDQDLLVVHLPAALAMSKFRTGRICKHAKTEPFGGRYGCRLLSKVLRPQWSMLGPSIFRILRELEAGILTTGQTLEQIKKIVKPVFHSEKNRQNQ
ncbi:MAG: hypothetical protein K9W43_03465 [Candidatus Thorarchaeota archaeon]|nr:hypothetical protein [Candidatus Thorarchaeota archaeon]